MTLDLVSALAIIGATSSLVWLILRLSLKPIEKELLEIREKMGQVKSEEDLKRMMQLEVAKHERGCRQDRLTETGIVKVR
jgi:hypothetical protein